MHCHLYNFGESNSFFFSVPTPSSPPSPGRVILNPNHCPNLSALNFMEGSDATVIMCPYNPLGLFWMQKHTSIYLLKSGKHNPEKFPVKLMFKVGASFSCVISRHLCDNDYCSPFLASNMRLCYPYYGMSNLSRFALNILVLAANILYLRNYLSPGQI